ncbi:MAG TPA: hypothetical protein VG273_06580 [Bryobacteraceae bacterium]|jgi:hypothetical protein|nr:hypothetical protein [Bryobacteraceae bacterium]
MSQASSYPSNDTAQRVDGEQAVHIAILIVLGLLISWPVLIHGAPDLSNDATQHAAWTSNFARQFWNGEWYPRWLMNMNGGLGSPDFFFYHPLHAFVSAMFWPLVRESDPHGWLISGYSSGVATVLSGITAYLWIRTLTTARAATIGAAIYMVVPYHVAIDLYNRGAAAEYWLFVWLPLVMLWAQRLVQDVPYSAVWLAVTYAMCVFSHSTVSSVFAAVPFAYVLLFSPKGSRLRNSAIAGAAIAAGTGIAAVYLFPAMLDRSKAFVAYGTSGWADYRNWWLFQIRGAITDAGTQGAGIPWYLSYKMRILVITLWMCASSIGAYLLVRARSGSYTVRRHASFYLGVTLVCFFLMLQSSDFVWRAIPVLRMIQFTNRLDTMIVVAVAVLGALAWASAGPRNAPAITAVFVLSILGWTAADALAASQGYGVWRHVSAERATRAAEMVDLQLEDDMFWPIDAHRKEMSDPPALARFLVAHPPRSASFAAGGEGDARVLNWGPRRIELSVHAPAGGHLSLDQFYYRGWRAVQKQTGAAIPLNPGPDGLMDLAVPPGTYDVTIDLPADTAERTGRLVSLLSLFLCALTALWQRRSIRHRVSGPPITLPQASAPF